MVDADSVEKAAMVAAGERAGEYIDAVKVTDMARWTGEQWHSFIEVICTGYVDSLIDQQAKAAVALAKVTG